MIQFSCAELLYTTGVLFSLLLPAVVQSHGSGSNDGVQLPLSVSKRTELSLPNVTNSEAETGRVFFKTDPADGSQSIVGSWFSFTSWTITFAFFGFSFLTALSAVATYYVLFVVTEPTQQGKRSLSNPFTRNSITSRLENWSFPQILDLLHMGHDIYSKLDLENMECQKKILCEFQEPGEPVNEGNDLSRKISNFLLFLNIFRNVPHIKQYQEAVRMGQEQFQKHKKSCDGIYPDCEFSVEKFNVMYNRVFGPLN